MVQYYRSTKLCRGKNLWGKKLWKTRVGSCATLARWHQRSDPNKDIIFIIG
jgi:hypothetical protein